MKLFAALFLLFNLPHSEARENLDGTWKPVAQEFAGAKLPEASFASQLLIIKDTTYVFNAESEDKGSINYSNGKMDIYGRYGVNAGRHFMTIYKFEGEKLLICYNLKGDKYPEDFSTSGKPAYFLSVYTRKTE